MQKNTSFRPPYLRRLGALLPSFWWMGDLPQTPDCRTVPPCRFLASHLSLIMFFALLMFMPRFESINFYQLSLKLSYFCKNQANFSSVGASRPPMASGGAPRPPKQPLLHCRFLVAHLILHVCCSNFGVLEYYREKLMR